MALPAASLLGVFRSLEQLDAKQIFFWRWITTNYNKNWSILRIKLTPKYSVVCFHIMMKRFELLSSINLTRYSVEEYCTIKSRYHKKGAVCVSHVRLLISNFAKCVSLLKDCNLWFILCWRKFVIKLNKPMAL